MMQPPILDMLLASGTVVLMVLLVLYQVYKLRWLGSHGREIIAMVTSIRHERGTTAWGVARDNYYLTATWTNPRTGRTYTYWAWTMDSSIAYTKGSLIPVLIDPNHPKRYVLNLGSSEALECPSL